MYEAFYGLRERPFSLLPDPDFLFLGEKHQAALDMLELAIFNHSGFCAISGEIGAGKTTLIRELLNRLGDNVEVGLVTNTHPSFGELMQWIVAAYGLETNSTDRVELYKQFIEFVIQRYAARKHTLLIIDEAQNLSIEAMEELRMLSNVNTDKNLVLQVILVGQQQLRDKLRRPELAQFAQRIAVDYHLTGLNRKETCDYIRFRLIHAGGAPDLFSDEACQAVYHYSSGIPRLINRASDLCLVYGYTEQSPVITARHVAAVVEDLRNGRILETADRRSRTLIQDHHKALAQSRMAGVDEPPVTAAPADAIEPPAATAPAQDKSVAPEAVVDPGESAQPPVPPVSESAPSTADANVPPATPESAQDNAVVPEAVVDSEESAQPQVPPVTAAPAVDAIEPPAATAPAQDKSVAPEAVVDPGESAQPPVPPVSETAPSTADGILPPATAESAQDSAVVPEAVVDSEESAQLQVPPVTASPTADAIEPPAAPSVAQDSAVVSEAVVEAADTAEAPSTLVEQASAVADDGSAAVTRETQTEDSDATVKRVAEEAAQDFKADDRDVLANEVPADSAGPTSDEVGAAEEEQQQAVEPSPELPVSVTSFVLSQSVPQAENSRLKQADATEAAQAEESVAPADLPVVAKAKQDRGPRRRGPLWSGLAALLVIGVTGWLGRDLWYPAPVPEMVAAKSTQKVPATDAERAGVETRASNAGAEIQTSAAKLALKEPESTEAQPLGATEGQAPSSVETQAAAETDGEQAPTVSVAAIETEEATLSEQSDPAVEEASENEQPATLQEPPSLTAAERLAKLKQDYARRKNEQPAGQDADVQQSTDDAEPLVTAKLDASPLAADPVSVKAAAVSEATKEHPAPTDAAAMENETDSHQTSGNVTDQQTGSAFDQKSAGQQTVTDSSGGEDSQREENQMQAVRRAAAMAAWESVRSEIEWVESSTPESKTAKSASKKKHTGKAEKSAAAGAPLSPASAAKEIEKLRKLEQAQRRLEQQLAAQRAERDRLKEEAEHERARAEEARKLIQEARERARLSWDQLQKTPEAYPEE